MPVWRNLGAVLLMLTAVSAGRAQTYPLAETVQAGDCFRIRLEMTLAGENRVRTPEDKTMPMKLAASASHEFPEKVLALGADGLPVKAARVYETAKVGITVAGDKSERSLRPERRLCVAQRNKDQFLLYCPAGSLTRDEVEVTEHLDTLTVTGLLPGKAVAVGETWKVPNAVAQALCGFEGLTEHDLTCKLEEVKDHVARVIVSGKATGIDVGALVKLQIDAGYRFDLTARRLVAVEWKQKDEREQGPVNPASSLESTVVLQRSVVAEPAVLSNVALVSVPSDFDPPAAMVQLAHRDPKGRYEMIYGREWYTVAETPEHMVMRLMERGDFVAQVTITPWTPARDKKHLTPDEFREAMEKTSGWEPERELQAGEVPTDGGRYIYRISALGQMDGVAVMQNFYLVASPEGEQVVLVFSMTPKQAEKIGSRDLSIAGSMDFPKR